MEEKGLKYRIKALRAKVGERLDQIKVPGFQGVGLNQVLTFFSKGLRHRRFNLGAMAMAYRFFFAMFPGLILLFILIPIIPIQNLNDTVRDFLNSQLPGDSFGFVQGVVDEFFQEPGFWTIVLNLLLVFYSATTGIKVMIHAFSRAEEKLFHRRDFIRETALAMAIFMVLFFLFLLMISLLIAGEYCINFLVAKEIIADGIVASLLLFLNWLIVLFTLQMATSAVYYLAPPTHERWNFFSPGSIVAGALMLGAILAFRVFITNFANYNKLYGSLGTVMMLMVWFYWISLVLLVGFELNTAILRAKLAGKAELEEEDFPDPEEIPEKNEA